MEILEHRDAWYQTYRDGWLATYEQTGKPGWKQYKRPHNEEYPRGAGISLSSSRLMLITSAGGYLTASQMPYDDQSDLGDYTIRMFANDTPLEALAFAHTHYDHTAVNRDPQVLVPLLHLQAMVAEGKIGGLTWVVSFMGYQPDATRVIDETIPLIVEAAQRENAQAALLVPS
jgi:hypothetical protein